MKKLISLRISPLTETQLTELTSKLGMTQTDVVTMAINDFYDKMEDKMNTILTQAHYEIIDWIGTDNETVENLTDNQARDMLKWLKENEINMERKEDIKKVCLYLGNR